MADKPRIPTPVFQTEKKEPTPQELADQFAKQAVKAALAPEPDGLKMLDELARIIPKPKGMNGEFDRRSQVVAMPTEIDKLIVLARAAANAIPVDWDTVRAIESTLTTMAQSDREKDAVERLAGSSALHEVHIALNAIERAFLEGKPNAEGNLRRF